MEEESEKPKFAQHTQKKHQNMFQNHNQMSYYDDYGEEDEDESEDEDDQHQENVFN